MNSSRAITNRTVMVNDSLLLDLDTCPNGQDLVEELPFQILFTTFYVFIFCIGTFGNALVAYVVMRNRLMYNPTNLFIANLACSDILMCLLSVPFTPLQSLTGRWLFGEVLCTLFPVSQGISVYISTLTMTLIAIDRYVVVCYPYRQRMQNKTSLLFIMVIDLLSLAFVLPYAFHIKMAVGFDGEERCNETWHGLNRLIYGVFTTFSQFVLPFITIIACYTTVIVRLRRRPIDRPGMASQMTHRQDQELKRTQRTNRMLMSMVIIFGTCWLPLNTINLIADLEIFPIQCWRYYHAFFIICHVIAMSSACFNPFLYGLYNESFKREFLQIWPALWHICGHLNSNANMNDTCTNFEMQKINTTVGQINNSPVQTFGRSVAGRNPKPNGPVIIL